MAKAKGICGSAVLLEKPRQIAFLALSALQPLTISPLPGEDDVTCPSGGSGGPWWKESVGAATKRNQRRGEKGLEFKNWKKNRIRTDGDGGEGLSDPINS